MEALKRLRDNAEHVKGTAEAFRALGQAFPSLAKVGDFVSADVVDAAVSAASLFLTVTKAEERALHEVAVAQRDHFIALAVKASDLAAIDLRAWFDRYDQAHEQLLANLRTEHSATTATLAKGHAEKVQIDALLDAMPV